MFSPKERDVIAYLKSLTWDGNFFNYPGRILGNEPIVNDEVIYGPWNGQRLADFHRAFPDCEMITWLAAGQHFYIKRYHYVNENVRTVHFVASGQSQIVGYPINSDAKFKHWIDRERWFARATCRNGEISEVETASRFRTGIASSVRRCGFASSLIYLCLLNVEHLPIPHQEYNKGYPVHQNPMFQQGNMPQINQGLIQPYCRRVIYTNYRMIWNQGTNEIPEENEDMTSEMAENQVHKSNKAFIYAAEAAHYHYLITFNPNPCQQGCCAFRNRKINEPHATDPGPSVTDNPNGKVFWIPDILSDFNKHEPASINVNPQFYSKNEPMFWQTKDFVSHNGRHWFFCTDQEPSPF